MIEHNPSTMDETQFVTREIEESVSVKQALKGQIVGQIVEVGRVIIERLKARNKLLIFGNGGSAADAQHIAAELVGRYQVERRALPAIALTQDMPILTAVGNDSGFERVFSRQIEALAAPGDIALAISTSGNSANILCALETARKRDVLRIGLTGKRGGKMRELTDLCICVPSDSTPRIQEAHILIGHLLCSAVERAFLHPEQK